MVNQGVRSSSLRDLHRAVTVYVVVVAGTVVALAALSVLAPSLAPAEAWGHAVVVAVFAVLLPLRLRSARRGSGSALTAVVVIAAVLAVVNAVEASLAVFPGWMRVEMVGIAALMVVTGLVAARARHR
jgi:hypothetical protein